MGVGTVIASPFHKVIMDQNLLTIPTRKKVALLLTGHARTYLECYPGIKQFLLDRYNVDVYISTWNCDQATRNDPIEPVDLSNLFALYNPKKYFVEDWAEYSKNKKRIHYVNEGGCRNWPGCIGPICTIHCESLEVVRNQYYIVKKGFELIENPNEYDFIIRMRMDMKFYKLEIDEKNILENTITVHKITFVDEWNCFICNDQIGYGDPASMAKYCNLYNSFEEMYTDKKFWVSIELAMWRHLTWFCNLDVKEAGDQMLYEFARKRQ